MSTHLVNLIVIKIIEPTELFSFGSNYGFLIFYTDGLYMFPGGALSSNGYWGCVAGWGRIFTTRLTIMGSPFQAFSIELLEWGRTFTGL